MRNTLLLLFLALYATAFSQTDYSGRKDNFILGVTAGGTFSQVDGDTYSGYHQPGFTGGGFVYKPISKYWDVQFEIVFKQKGSSKTADVKNEDYAEYYINLNYVELPIVARYHFGRFSAEGGLYFGTLISSKEGDTNGDFDEGETNAFTTFEMGTLVGLNFHFTPKLWINAKLGYSLTPIREPYDGNIEIYQPVKHIFTRKPGEYNNVMSFALYYAFK